MFYYLSFKKHLTKAQFFYNFEWTHLLKLGGSLSIIKGAIKRLF